MSASGSVPKNYERHLVPLLFLDYAADLASRLDVPAGGSVLETACGRRALTRQQGFWPKAGRNGPCGGHSPGEPNR